MVFHFPPGSSRETDFLPVHSREENDGEGVHCGKAPREQAFHAVCGGRIGMLVLSFLLVGIVLIACQSSVLYFLPSWMGTPDLIFILIIFLAYRFDWLRGLVLVLAFGWIMDVVSGLYLGTYPLLYLFLFVFLKIIKEKSPVKEAVYQIPLVGVAYLVSYSFLYSFYLLVLPEVLPEWSWPTMVRQILLLVVASIPCFLLYNKLFEQMSKRRFIRPRILRKRSGNYFR